MSFKLEISHNNKKISFGRRLPGHSGKDILAVKIALGIIQESPDGVDSANPDPGDASSSRPPIPMDNQRWFDCKSGNGIDLARASLFDSKLKKILKTFQIKNQFLILSYLFEKKSIKSLIKMSTQAYTENPEQQGIDKSIYEQINIIQELFDRELEVLGEATIAVLHGWRPLSIASSPGYYHSQEVYREDQTVVDIIPEVLYQDLTDGRLGQTLEDLYSNGAIAGSAQFMSQEKLDYYKSKVSESQAWANQFEQQINFKYGSIDYTPIVNPSSLLFSSAKKVLEISSLDDELRALSPETETEFLRRSLYPDPFVSTDPFYINQSTIGVHIETDFELNPDGPLPNLEQETIGDLEERALIHVLKFFNKPDYIWYMPNNDSLKTAYFARQEFSPEHDGVLPSNEKITKEEKISAIERYFNAHNEIVETTIAIQNHRRAYPTLDRWLRMKEIIDNAADVPPGTEIPVLDKVEKEAVDRYEKLTSKLQNNERIFRQAPTPEEKSESFYVFGITSAVEDNNTESTKLLQHYTAGDAASGVPALVKFIEYKTPSLRPNQKYRALFEINKEKLDLIEKGISTSELGIGAPDTNTPVLPEVCEDLDSSQTKRTLEEYRLHAKKRRREIVRKLKDAVNQRNASQFKPGATRGGQIDLGTYGPFDLNATVLGPFGLESGGSDYEYTSKVFAALINSGEAGIEAMLGEGYEQLDELAREGDSSLSQDAIAQGRGLQDVDKLEINLQELKERIEEAKRDLTESDRIIKREGIAIDPKSKFNGSNEASLLGKLYSELKQVISSFLESSGRSADSTMLATAGPDQLEKVIVYAEFTPTVTLGPGPKNGRVFKKLSFTIRDPDVGTPSDNLAQTRFMTQTRALRRERTVNYFFQIKEMTGAFATKPTRTVSFLDDNRGSCRDLGLNLDKRLAISYIGKYTSGLKISKENSKTLGKAWHSWYKSTIRDPAVSWADTSVKNLKSSTDDTFDEDEALRALGRLTSWEELYREFFDKLSLPALMCDYVKCIKLPGIDLKLPSFYLPPLPSVPIIGWYMGLFDFIVEQWYNILMRFLQSWVRGVIDKLSIPFCQEQLSEFIAAGSLTGIAAADQALRDSLIETGIPKTRVDDSKEFFEEVSNITTGQELCRLFSGRPLDESAMNMVNRIVEKNNLQEFIGTEETLLNYFEVISQYLPTDLCEQLSQADRLATPPSCKDTSQYLQSIRNRLQTGDSTLTDEEIDEVLDLAKQEVENSKNNFDAFSGSEIADVMPSFYAPGDPDAIVGDYPPFLQKEIESTAKDLFATARLSYSSAMDNYIPAMSISMPVDPAPGEPGYREQEKLRLEAALSQLSMYTMSIEKQSFLTHKLVTELLGQEDLTQEEEALTLARENLFQLNIASWTSYMIGMIYDPSLEAERDGNQGGGSILRLVNYLNGWHQMSEEEKDQEWEGLVDDHGRPIDRLPATADALGTAADGGEHAGDYENAAPLRENEAHRFDPYYGALINVLIPDRMSDWNSARNFLGDKFMYRLVTEPEFFQEFFSNIKAFEGIPVDDDGDGIRNSLDVFDWDFVQGAWENPEQLLDPNSPLWRDEFATAFGTLNYAKLYGGENITKTGNRWNLDYDSVFMKRKIAIACLSIAEVHDLQISTRQRMRALRYSAGSNPYNTLGNIMLLYSAFRSEQFSGEESHYAFRKHVVKAQSYEELVDTPPQVAYLDWDTIPGDLASGIESNLELHDPVRNPTIIADYEDMDSVFNPRLAIASRGFLAGVLNESNIRGDDYIGMYPGEATSNDLASSENQVLLEVVPLRKLAANDPDSPLNGMMLDPGGGFDDDSYAPIPPIALTLNNPLPLAPNSSAIDERYFAHSTIEVYREIIRETYTPTMLESGLDGALEPVQNGDVELATDQQIANMLLHLTFRSPATGAPDMDRADEDAPPNSPTLIRILKKRLNELAEIIQGTFRNIPTLMSDEHLVILENALRHEPISEAFEDIEYFRLLADFGPYTPTIEMKEQESKRYYDRYDISISSDFHIGQANNRNKKTFKFCEALPQSVYEYVQPPRLDDENLFSKREAFAGILNTAYIEGWQPSNQDVENLSISWLTLDTDEVSPESSNSYYAKITRDTTKNIEEKFLSAPLFDPEYAESVKKRITGAQIIIPGNRCVKNRYGTTDDSVISFDKAILPDPNMDIMREMSKPENSPYNQSFDTPGGFEKGLQNVAIKAFVRVCLVDSMFKGGLAYSVWDMASVISEEIYISYIVDHVRLELEKNVNFKDIWEEIIERTMEINNASIALDALVREEIIKFSNYSRQVFNPSREKQDAYDWYLQTFVQSVPMSNLTFTVSGKKWTENNPGGGNTPQSVGFILGADQQESSPQEDFGVLGEYKVNKIEGSYDQRKMSFFIEEYVKLSGRILSEEIYEQIPLLFASTFANRFGDYFGVDPGPHAFFPEREVHISVHRFNILKNALLGLGREQYLDIMSESTVTHGSRLMLLVPFNQSRKDIEYRTRDLHRQDKQWMEALSSCFLKDASRNQPHFGAQYDARKFLSEGVGRVIAEAAPGTYKEGHEQQEWAQFVQPAGSLYEDRVYFQAASIPIVKSERELTIENCESFLSERRGLGEEHTRYIIQSLKESQRFQDIFDHIFPIKRFISMYSLFSTATLSGYNDVPNILRPVKNAISSVAMISSLSTAEQHDILSDPGQTEFQNFFNTKFPASDPKESLCFDFPLPGRQFFDDFLEALGKAIKSMPSIILRGIANQMDPAYKEMRQHYLNCDIKDFRIHKALEYRFRTTIDKRLVNGLHLKNNVHRRDEGRYQDVLFGATADFVAWLFNDITQWGSRSGRWALKIVSYAYSGAKPFVDSSFGFRIPCKDQSPDWIRGGKYDAGRYGRYGHPLSPITLLALSVPELQSDKDLKERLCIANNENSVVNMDDCPEEEEE